ncbi:MAG TPA: polyribonucleotide nucleotidyltransferase [Candidatus Bathyarchaeia archaeon]|nr:polyribonucleotide nucleotidyltransferase [Candidatus Bathyarchaeia archaeon]
MDISSIMSSQLASLKHTVSLSVLNMAKTTQAAGAAAMIQDFSKAQSQIQASHPTSGGKFDVSV